LAARPLQFIFIVDCSGSMGVDGKIEALNTAIRETIPHMREVARDNAQARVMVRALKFSSGATWHVATPTPIEDFEWSDLQADGVTDMGRAMSMLAEQLDESVMPGRGIPPVLVLVSDGQPTDDFGSGLKELFAQQWARKAVRLAIAIGSDADLGPLRKFIDNVERKVLQANSAPQLVKDIKWASTDVLRHQSRPASQTHEKNGDPLPPPPERDDDDVW
jgi:uncharacterized protein YegL